MHNAPVDGDHAETAGKMAKPALSNKLFYSGILLTAGWLIAVSIWWAPKFKAIQSLDPSGFGDFLGGTFAPVAFLWLVLGFLQQGKELRNSADALWLQMEELRNSVDQQRDLVGATRDLRITERELHDSRMAEERRAALPMITIVAAGGSTSQRNDSYEFRYTIRNSGRPCNEVQVVVNESLKRRIARMESGDFENFAIDAPLEERVLHRCSVSWIDERNHPGSRIFEIVTHRQDRTIELIESDLSEIQRH